MLSLADTRLARRLIETQAVIVKSSGDVFPAYPRGDRRKRPSCWVSLESFQTLSSYGGLKRGVWGYKVVESFERRLKAGDTIADQHRDIFNREIYDQNGRLRPVRINRSLSAMDRLYRRRDKSGQTLLTDAEYEAGKRYARDYALAGYEVLTTQNYMSAGADKAPYFGEKENLLHGRIDARRRLEQANTAIGKGLDKTIIAVCCLDRSLEQVERAEKWAIASGFTVLKLGLGALADHYGTKAGGASIR